MWLEGLRKMAGQSWDLALRGFGFLLLVNNLSFTPKFSCFMLHSKYSCIQSGISVPLVERLRSTSNFRCKETTRKIGPQLERPFPRSRPRKLGPPVDMVKSSLHYNETGRVILEVVVFSTPAARKQPLETSEICSTMQPASELLGGRTYAPCKRWC
jgi:hypothetical protein